MLQNLEIVPSAEPRADLLNWLNSLLPEVAPNGTTVPHVRKVEQCGNCAAYCLILPDMLPIRCPSLLTRVKVPAHHDFEAATNLKIMSDALQRNGILKPTVLLDHSDKMIRGNFQANLQMLQWFRGLHTALQEADIEPGQGRVTLDPGLNSLSHSHLSGPIPEDTVLLRRLNQHPPLHDRVAAINDHGDATAAAAAAVLREARSRSMSLDVSEHRRDSFDRLGESYSHELSASRNGVPPHVPIHSGSRAPPVSAAAASRVSRAAPTPAAKRGASVGAGTPYAARSTAAAAGGRNTTPASASLRVGTRGGGSGAVTPLRRGTPNRTTPRVGKGNRTPKSPALGTPWASVGGGGRAPPAGNGVQRPVSPPPRAPQPAVKPAAAPTADNTGTRSSATTTPPASSAGRRAPSTISYHQPPASLSSSLNNGLAAGPSPAAYQQQLRRLEDAEEQLRQAQAERQFYYDKLRMIETLVRSSATWGGEQQAQQSPQSAGDVSIVRLTRSIRDILYATN